MRTEETVAPAREGSPGARGLVRRALAYAVGVFLVLRVALSVLSLASVALLPHPGEAAAGAAGIPGPVGAPGWQAEPITPGLHNATSGFERFDALWFLGIATGGYEDGNGSAVFFPGYPLMIRAISPLLGGHPLAAALLISNAAAFGAFVMLYLLTARELDEAAARKAVLYLAVFPTSFFLLAPYSEAPFLLFVLLSLWGARLGRWWLAGVAGAAAALTRNLGVVLTLALAVEAIHQRREGRSGSLGARLGWSAGPALGLGAYLLFWQLSAGNWHAPLTQQATWQRELAAPPVTIALGTFRAFEFPGTFPGGYHLLDWLVVMPALGFAGWAALRTRPMYSIYAWASILVPLSYIFPPRPFMSLPRFLVVVFPILWAPAVLSRHRPWLHGAWTGVSAALLGVLTLLFVNWYYVF